MSQFNRKGFTTVKYKGKDDAVHHAPVRSSGKLARTARHRNKQMEKQHHQRIRDYKARLRAEKKKYPVEQRAHLKLQDLIDGAE